jgi:hypothetical protein
MIDRFDLPLVDARFNHHETYATAGSSLPREFVKIIATSHAWDWAPIWEMSPVVNGEVNTYMLVRLRLTAPLIRPSILLRRDFIATWRTC